MRTLVVLLTLLAGVYAAHAFGLGEGNRFGKLGAGGGGVAAPPPVLTNLRITNTGAFRTINTGDNRAVFP
jgi:hypothetical protein